VQNPVQFRVSGQASASGKMWLGSANSGLKKRETQMMATVLLSGLALLF
jgi:hypothetical protein